MSAFLFWDSSFQQANKPEERRKDGSQAQILRVLALKVKFSVPYALKASKTTGLKNTGFSTWPANFGLLRHAPSQKETASTHAKPTLPMSKYRRCKLAYVSSTPPAGHDAEGFVAFFHPA